MSFTIKTNDVSDDVLDQRRKFNDILEARTRADKAWHEYASIDDYHQAIIDGIALFPKPEFDQHAREVLIPSSHGSHHISLRSISPRESSAAGVLLHFHAGGFCAGSARFHDPYLRLLAESLNVTIVSVEYRLAPQNTFPAALEDALDASNFALSPEGEARLGGKLLYIGGESAGAYLTAWTVLELRNRGVDVRKQLNGLVLSYGIYDMTYLPSCRNYSRNVVMDSDAVFCFIDTALPRDKFSMETRKDPKFSPLYSDLHSLPPALFLVGDEDPLFDDSIFMATKWGLAGNQSTLKIIPGAFHGFTLQQGIEVADEGIQEVIKFLRGLT